MKIAAACFLGLLSPLVSFAQAASDDPYAWLEDVSGDRALTWARAQNAVSQRELEASPNFKPIYDRLLTVLDSNARIPYVTKEGGLYYNFWHDAQHPRGVWRRTTLAEYRKPEPAWETVLDLDALAAAEKESWVWNDVLWLRPQHDRVLLELSRGGGDAVVIREFDLMTKSFVTDGFNAPEAKTDVAWRNRDSIYIGSNFGADSTTTSGYARIVKEWKRGTPLSAARTVFAGEVGDVSVRASVSERFGFHHEFIRRGLTFFTS